MSGLRVLLSALNCKKARIDANLDAHIAVLAEAQSAGCRVAVFPEFSLTGSVDPATQPEHVIGIEDPAVCDLVSATGRTGVAAIVGIAERAEGGFYITQLVADGGKLRGAYRKRHLGEGEEAYRVGVTPGSFEVDDTTFGIVICAEGGTDFAWDDIARSGASVAFFCSAPGLYGRRTDETSWRTGHRWWEECGLGDAVTHARKEGLWVAMATQAGETVDEDFPGIAALVSPAGAVVSRTPDWRPANLVVEIPPPPGSETAPVAKAGGGS